MTGLYCFVKSEQHPPQSVAHWAAENSWTREEILMQPSELIDKQISDLPDWRGRLMARLRILIHQADPDLDEDWKWNTPVWSLNGAVCAVGAFKDHIKINFFKGASLSDPHGLFNSGLEAKTSRSIDLFEGDTINEPAIKDLIRSAAAYNKTSRK
jgi:hypothetical protein